MRHLIIIFVFIPIIFYGQKKDKSNTNQLQTSFKTFEIINKLNQINNEVFIGTYLWYYDGSNFENKDALNELINITYPDLKLQISRNAVWGNSKFITECIGDLDSLIEISRVTTLPFREFADYENDLKLKKGKDILTNVLKPHFSNCSKYYETLISREESVFKNYINEPLDTEDYKTLINIWKTYSDCSDVMIYTLSWIYSKNDEGSKLRLLSILNDSKNPSKPLLLDNNIYHQAIKDSLGSHFDKIKKYAKQITSNLSQGSDFQDPLKLLISQDLFTYMQIYFKQLKVEQKHFNEVLEQRILEKENPARQKKLKSISKIIRMLYKETDKDIQKKLLLCQEKKADRRFNYDDLVKELVPLYDAKFTTPEINEMLIFLSSSTGKKFIDLNKTLLVEVDATIDLYFKRLIKNEELANDGF